MSTPAMDLMSSPDPLNVSATTPVPPSSRRVTRSQASQRFMSLGTSPRKQKFTLDVGNEHSPQKILVTVEADDHSVSNVNRRLFQSPTPKRATRRREKTTTVTVPLRGLTDDEGGTVNRASTPKKRAKELRTGTPATTRRKRAVTPAQSTPRTTRRTRTSKNDDTLTLTSEMSVEDNDATPKASARTTRKRKTPTPANGDDDKPAQPRKRGRPRKQKVVEEVPPSNEEDEVSLIEIEETTPAARNIPPAGHDSGFDTEENASVAGTEASIPVADSVSPARSSNTAGGDDIWMATLSDPPAQAGRRRTSPQYSAELENADVPAQEEPEQEWPDPVEYHAESEDDGAPSQASVDWAAAGAPSEAESVAEEQQAPATKDTVMIGEEFTMISIGSLPSMQPNSSIIATEPQELGEDTSLIINQTLESMRRSLNNSGNDVAEEAGEEEDSAPSTAAQAAAEKNTLEVVGSTSMFAQQTSHQAWARSPRRAKPQPLGRQLALKSLQREDGIERPRNLRTEAEHDTSVYDDSFSEIPEDVLEAATPKPMKQAQLQDMSGMEDIAQPSVERPSMVIHSDPQSDSKLLTPDETPSPSGSEGDQEKADQSASKSDADAAPEMRSSPPVFNFTLQGSSESVVRHSRHNSSETPVGNFASPRLPPRVEEAEAQMRATLAPPERTPRPTFSPIMRAGRALQLVTSDPPSPSARSSVLGSPFRGSVGKPSQSPAPVVPTAEAAPTPTPVQQQSSAQKSNTTWSKAFAPFSQIKNLVSQGAQVFSPRTAPAPALEDPFGPGPENGTLPDHSIADVGLFNGAIGRATRAASTTSSTRAAPPSDEMSWQADNIPTASHEDSDHDTMSSSVRGRGGSPEIHSAEVEMMDDPVEVARDETGLEEQLDDDDDIWAIEAQRPTPRAPKAALAPQSVVLNPPRRGKLPSPWRQNSKRLLYNDELHKLASGNSNDDVHVDEPEEFSMLSLPESEPPSEPKQTGPVAPASKKTNLSAFFSSPALIPEATQPEVNIFRFAENRGNARAQPEPQVPQQASSSPKAAASMGLDESQGRLGRSSYFGTGPQKEAMTSTSSAGPPGRQTRPDDLFAPVPQKALQIGRQPRVDLFSPVKRVPNREEVVAHSSSPVTPERPSLFSHVPQKTNFTPRLRQAGNSLFEPVSRPRSSSSDNEPVEPFVESDAESDFESEVDTSGDGSFVPPQLKPLPSRAVSPSKSCIRSPLKPKTPGRVVEFASSTMSPLAQAQARAERRASASPEKQAPEPVAVVTHFDADKENQVDSELSSVASPSPSPVARRPQPMAFSKPSSKSMAETPARLSQTQWSRQHWLRLDELLQQMRRGGTLQFQLHHGAVAAAAAQKRKNGSGSAALLGKIVTSQGETMVLEQWHLDIIDAFAAEVGGWDDTTLAKRLFALMVGEERRRQGLVPARRGVR